MSDDRMEMYAAKAEVIEIRNKLQRMEQENEELKNILVANNLIQMGEKFIEIA